MAKREKVYEYKRMKSRGAELHLIRIKGETNWKFHSWDGPSIKPLTKDCELKEAYYLHGILYNKDNYMELLKQREGLPWFKSPSQKGDARL